MKYLIKEYRDTLRSVTKSRMKATDKDERCILGSCIDSLEFAIEYMEKGKHPDNRRAITRRSGIEREVPMDPESFAFIREAALQRIAITEISPSIQKGIDDLGLVLSKLSSKEQEAYILVRGNGYSFRDAARLMRMQKGTVQVLVKRAEDKIYDLVADLTEQGIVFKRPVQTAFF